MRLVLRRVSGSGRWTALLTLTCLSLAAAGDAVALVTVDTTHTGAGALVMLRRNGEYYPTCSGTLIAPDVFLTAGHCTSGLKALMEIGAVLDVFVSFDTQFTQTASLVSVAGLITHPGHPRDAWSITDYSHDIGVAILATPELDRPIAHLPAEGLMDLLHPEPGTPVTAVGYGRDSNDHHGTGRGSPHWDIFYTGLRSSGTLSYRALMPAFIMVTQLANQGDDNMCFGDSGGPSFIQVDGQEQIVAVSSLINSYSCEEIAWLVRLDTPDAREFLGQFVDLP